MNPYHQPSGIIFKRTLYALAWVSSLALLLLLRIENAPAYVAMLAVVSSFLWYGAYKVNSPVRGQAIERELSGATTSDSSITLHDQYFQRLISSLEKNWLLCDTDLDQAHGTLRNVHHSLIDAIDTAKSTGMLALNSMVAAASTGEVGRGFVTVSKDLVSISDQSGDDLLKMKDIVARAELRLSHTRRWMDTSLNEHLAHPGVTPLAELIEAVACVQSGQEQLRRIAEHYQRNSKSDVRWLQLGDAVRRLLNEVINVLYQFELRLIDVISDMRLLRLSGTLSGEQLIEFKGRIQTNTEMEDAN